MGRSSDRGWGERDRGARRRGPARPLPALLSLLLLLPACGQEDKGGAAEGVRGASASPTGVATIITPSLSPEDAALLDLLLPQEEVAARFGVSPFTTSEQEAVGFEGVSGFRATGLQPIAVGEATQAPRLCDWQPSLDREARWAGYVAVSAEGPTWAGNFVMLFPDVELA